MAKLDLVDRFSLMAITDFASGAPPADLPAWLEALCRARIDLIQVRAKDFSDRALCRLAGEIVAQVGERIPVVINGRFDIARAVGAAGVHLPAAGLPAARIRERCGEGFLIGCSTHSRSDVEAARAAGATYAVFGPIFATPSKNSTELQGLAKLRSVTSLGLPILALGGIGPESLTDVRACGAAGAAGIRVFRDPERLSAMVKLRDAWQGV
jgi:thiamine-phosphate pyrophosphorylase